eukprot:2459916-Pleurochrysis_carterae.AAC.1
MSYKLSALRAVPWLAEQALESAVAAVHDNNQVDYVKVNGISGGCRKSTTPFGHPWTQQNNRTEKLVFLYDKMIRLKALV